MASRRIIGIDPGLVKPGWGVIDVSGNQFKYVACGTIKPNTKLSLPARLLILHEELQLVLAQYSPSEAAIEETFVSANGQSTLKLGQARGALLLSLGIAGLQTAEYAPTLIKKSITGVGRADKHQIKMMVGAILPTGKLEIEKAGEDACDALAIAICHANHAKIGA